jgi:hypothetical protein
MTTAEMPGTTRMNTMRRRLGGMLIYVAILAGCKSTENDTMTVDRLRGLVESSLLPGDPEQAVIGFLERQGWGYDYWRPENRYQTRCREAEKSKWESVILYLYLDDSRRFVRGEVKVYHTYL